MISSTCTGPSFSYSSSSSSSIQQEIEEIKKELKDLQKTIKEPNADTGEKEYARQRILQLGDKENMLLQQLQPNQGKKYNNNYIEIFIRKQ
jgi:RNA polymerase-binding transcription factor DksA